MNTNFELLNPEKFLKTISDLWPVDWEVHTIGWDAVSDRIVVILWTTFLSKDEDSDDGGELTVSMPPTGNTTVKFRCYGGFEATYHSSGSLAESVQAVRSDLNKSLRVRYENLAAKIAAISKLSVNLA